MISRPSQWPQRASSRHSRSLAATVVLAALVIALPACSILTGDPATTSTGGTKNNLFTGDAGPADDAGLATDVTSTGADTGVAPIPCDCLKEGDWYRFDKLKIESLDGALHNVMFALNPLWKQDVEGFELNFYFQVIKVSATEVTISVVNGARVDGSTDKTCLLPYTSAMLIHPRTGCTLEDSAESAMNVYAGTESNKKNCAPKNAVPHAIEVRKAVMNATFANDCSKILTGKVVSGSLSQASLEQTCTCVNPGKAAEECGVLDPAFKGNSCDGCNEKYQNLKTLLENFGELQWKCTVDGKPAVCLEASFSAVRIDKAPEICKGL